MQRKNRAPNEGSNCLGTDLNRNYDSSWGSEYRTSTVGVANEAVSVEPASN